MSITKNINKAVFTWRWHWAVSSASTSTREALLASSGSTTSSALNSVAGSSWPCSLLNLMGGKIIVTIQKGIMLWSDSWSPYWKCARMCLLWWWCHMELLMRVLWQRYQKKGCHLEAPLVSPSRYWFPGIEKKLMIIQTNLKAIGKSLLQRKQWWYWATWWSDRSKLIGMILLPAVLGIRIIYFSQTCATINIIFLQPALGHRSNS